MKAARLLLLLPFAGAALAQAPASDPCVDAYNAELIRIERELKRQPNDGSEQARQRIARMARAQTRLAANQAEQCQGGRGARAAGQAPAGKGPGIEQTCGAQADARLSDLNQRYSGRRLGEAEQKNFNDEQERIQADVQECIRRGG